MRIKMPQLAALLPGHHLCLEEYCLQAALHAVGFSGGCPCVAQDSTANKDILASAQQLTSSLIKDAADVARAEPGGQRKGNRDFEGRVGCIQQSHCQQLRHDYDAVRRQHWQPKDGCTPAHLKP